MNRFLDLADFKREQVLDLLVKDPHTAHHISFEIAQRFVSDNPPDALVDRMSQTFLKSDGDIREVLHTMIYSPEFWSKDAYRAKIKTPFEMVASATRAVGAEVDVPLMLVQWTTRIGEALYQCEPPTGYSSKADAWVNTGALLNRMNFSLALTANRLRGVQVDMEPLLGQAGADPYAMLDRAVQELLGLRVVGGFYQPLSGSDPRARGLLDSDGGVQLECVRGDAREHGEVQELLDGALAMAREVVAEAGRGEIEARPSTCAFGKGGCEFPTICRCER